jgi:serine phosphatase RsbU (regulator of sigma subunit)
MKKYSFILSLFFVVTLQLKAQVPSSVADEVKRYDNNIKESLAVQDKSSAASNANKAAFLLSNAGAYAEAVKYFQQALDLNIEMDNQNGAMIIQNSMGLLYSDMEKYDLAIKHYQEGLKLSRKMKMRETTASTLTNMAVAYQQLGKYKESNNLLDEAVTIASEANNLRLLRLSYGTLYDNYNNMGDSDKAYEYFTLYQSLDKEIKKVEMQEVKQQAESDVNVAQQETQATKQELTKTSGILRQTEDSLARAEQLTREQRLELDLKESEIQKEQAKLQARNRLIYGIAGVLLITLLFLMIVFRQKNAITRQKEQIERQNKNIRASIRYAQTIQNAMLPPEIIENELFEAWVIYMPKDIVSGDFYWYSPFTPNGKSEAEIISVIDCTGHGVPGAFMSMIGNRLLNELVNEKEIGEPSAILDNIDYGVRTSLRQDETDNNDGMDLSLCKFEKDGGSVKLTYAGAKRPLYCIFKDTKEISRVKGSRKSIGGKGRNTSKVNFKQEELSLQSGDMVYIFSDGIVDQNDNTRRRFGSQKLEETFLKMCTLDTRKQKEYLQDIIDAFIQNEEQRDDITIMGIKIK